MTLDYYSAFTGIGGFDLAFNRLGMRATAMTEIDPSCQTVLQRHFPNVPLKGDISDVRATEIGRPDLFVGGFPCNDTSIAAPHRAGLAGKRSGNFYEFTRLLGEYQRLIDAQLPRWVVIENPPGLLRSNGGRDMAAVVYGLEELGYGWAFRVVDGRHLHSAGRRTPQRRERVIVVGHLGGDAAPAGEVLGLPADRHAADRAHQVGRPAHGPRAVPSAVRGAVVWRKSARPRAALSEGGYETWVPDGTANTLTGFDGGGPARQTHLIAQGGGVRTLTLTEWERLQGFPDGWTEGIQPGDVRRKKVLIRAGRYTMIGNAIHTGTAEWLGRRLLDVHNSLHLIGV